MGENMKWGEYKKVAVQRLNKAILNDPKESMNYACMGLIEETGEIIAELRKPLFKGNFHEKELDIQNLKSELGDLMWYIALMCKENNIDIEELKKIEENKEEAKLPRREEIIRAAINIGQSTGKIVQECIGIYNGDRNNQKLVNEISEQYVNINKLSGLLDIKIEQVLDENIKKINSRYNEKGEVNR